MKVELDKKQIQEIARCIKDEIKKYTAVNHEKYIEFIDKEISEDKSA